MCCFFLNLYLLQDNWLYNIVFVSAIYQHESATGVHISPPSWTSLPPPIPSHPTPLGCHRAPGWASCVIQQIPLFSVWRRIVYDSSSTHASIPPPETIKFLSLFQKIGDTNQTEFLNVYVLSLLLSDAWPESTCICGFEWLLEEYFPLKPGSISSEHQTSWVSS